MAVPISEAMATWRGELRGADAGCEASGGVVAEEDMGTDLSGRAAGPGAPPRSKQKTGRGKTARMRAGSMDHRPARRARRVGSPRWIRGRHRGVDEVGRAF